MKTFQNNSGTWMTHLNRISLQYTINNQTNQAKCKI